MHAEMGIWVLSIAAAGPREAHNRCARDAPCAVRKMNLKLLLHLQLLLQLLLNLLLNLKVQHQETMNVAIPYQETARGNTTIQCKIGGLWVLFIAAAKMREAQDRCDPDAPCAVEMMNLNPPLHLPLQLIW